MFVDIIYSKMCSANIVKVIGWWLILELRTWDLLHSDNQTCKSCLKPTIVLVPACVQLSGGKSFGTFSVCWTLQSEHCHTSRTCLIPREAAKYQSESHYLSCQSLQTEWRPGEDNEVGRNLSEENFLNFKTKVDSCCFCQNLSCIPPPLDLWRGRC